MDEIKIFNECIDSFVKLRVEQIDCFIEEQNQDKERDERILELEGLLLKDRLYNRSVFLEEYSDLLIARWNRVDIEQVYLQGFEDCRRMVCSILGWERPKTLLRGKTVLPYEIPQKQ